MFLSLTHSPCLLFFITIFLFNTPPCIQTRSIPSLSPEKIHGNDKMQNLERFAKAHRGGNASGISDIKRYFSRFGYLLPSLRDDNKSFTYDDAFDPQFESAVVLFQSALGLPVSGKLDLQTLSQIAAPRCGVPDDMSHAFHSTKRFVYFPGKPRWTRRMPMRLTYAFSTANWVSSPTSPDVRRVFRRAFSRWASVIPVSFTETDDYGFADIRIGFYYGDHGDGEPFDGVLGILAHSFSPESGRLHLDAAETWATDFETEKSTVAVDLESVATHEIGHLLGLAHSPVKDAVMYPSLNPREKKADLQLDDIKGVQALYGSNPKFRFESLLASDTSANQAVNLRIGSRRRAHLTLVFIALWLFASA